MDAIIELIIFLTLVKPFTTYAQKHDYLDLLAIHALKNTYFVKTTLIPRSAKYDFIVIGAGPGGAVVANRLSENSNWKVLLLEAGKPEGVKNQIPFFTCSLALSDYNWGYTIEPQKNACFGIKNRRGAYARGKSLGGSSTLNYMIYSRGSKIDFDEWAAQGNYGWSYDEVLPYFKKSENAKIEEPFDAAYHGTDGYVNVQTLSWHSPLAKAFLDAGKTLGYDIIDYNGKNQIGFSYLQTTTVNGTRCSSAKSYLRVIRQNLDIMTEARATKLLIDHNKRVYGVEFVKSEITYRIKASKEIISSAGTIDTAKLLMLSGIGPGDHLGELGIKVVKDAKVGFNMYDHVGFAGITFLVNESVSFIAPNIQTETIALQYAREGSGPYCTAGGSEALAFIRTKYATDARPDLELLFMPGTFNIDNGTFRTARRISDEVYDTVWKPLQNTDTWAVWCIVQQSRSKGRIKLRSANVLDDPIIDPHLLEDPRDLDILIEGVKLSIELSETEAFQKYNSKVHKTKIPGCENFDFGSNGYWRCAIQHVTITLDHEMGTAKMGPRSDPDAVVDPELRVYGVQRLRIVDASIIPKIPIGHLTATLYMIAEKSADMIKQTWDINRHSHRKRLGA